MADQIGPEPGFVFQPGRERGGKEWITETTRIIEREATQTLPGRVKKMPAQSDSTATTVAGIVADHNALLAKLRAAGLMEVI